jgi:Arm domain-containing DNA-binding protein
MAKPLTPVTISNLRARDKRYEVSDGGCHGLRIVVFPSRRKSFIVRYRFRGLQRKLTLGGCLTERGVAETLTTPETGTPLSLAAARELATKALRQASSSGQAQGAPGGAGRRGRHVCNDQRGISSPRRAAPAHAAAAQVRSGIALQAARAAGDNDNQPWPVCTCVRPHRRQQRSSARRPRAVGGEDAIGVVQRA